MNGIDMFGNNSISGYASMTGFSYDNTAKRAESFSPTSEEGKTDAQIKALKRSGVIECETCSSRQYKDGSNESDVSFKAPGHISPQASAGVVAAHEQQHVANAHQKAGSSGGTLVSASVSLQRAVCPECGRSYVAGGTTSTAIRYPENNPYGKNIKSMDAANGFIGSHIDARR